MGGGHNSAAQMTHKKKENPCVRGIYLDFVAQTKTHFVTWPIHQNAPVPTCFNDEEGTGFDTVLWNESVHEILTIINYIYFGGISQCVARHRSIVNMFIRAWCIYLGGCKKWWLICCIKSSPALGGTFISLLSLFISYLTRVSFLQIWFSPKLSEFTFNRFCEYESKIKQITLIYN